MTKRIAAKIEEYQKDGETKGKYVDIGVILQNDNGEFMLLNSEVNLAGVLMKQRLLAAETGKKAGNTVICSIFDNSNQQGSQSAQPNNSIDSDIPF